MVQENERKGLGLRQRRKMRVKKFLKNMETRRQQRTIRIMVNNVNGGLRAEPDPKKWDDLCEWIEQRQPDIVMLQETKLNQVDEKKIKIPAGYEMIAAGLKKERMRGVMTLVSQELAMGIRKEKNN